MSIYKNCIFFLLFRVVEIHRICEATATPATEGANLSEYYLNNKRIRTRNSSPLFVSGLLFCKKLRNLKTAEFKIGGYIWKNIYLLQNP